MLMAQPTTLTAVAAAVLAASQGPPSSGVRTFDHASDEPLAVNSLALLAGVVSRTAFTHVVQCVLQDSPLIAETLYATLREMPER